MQTKDTGLKMFQKLFHELLFEVIIVFRSTCTWQAISTAQHIVAHTSTVLIFTWRLGWSLSMRLRNKIYACVGWAQGLPLTAVKSICQPMHLSSMHACNPSTCMLQSSTVSHAWKRGVTPCFALQGSAFTRSQSQGPARAASKLIIQPQPKL